jgi:hypothetical protein
MPHEDELVRAQLAPQQFGQLDAVLRHARDGDRPGRRAAVLAERPAGAALVPLHDGEVFRPSAEAGISPRVDRIARSAVQEQQHRIVPVVAADGDPLLDAADLDEPGLVNAVRGGGGEVARISRPEEGKGRVEFLQVGAAAGLRRITLRARRARGDGDDHGKQTRGDWFEHLG